MFIILIFWGILNILEIFFSQSFLPDNYYNETFQLALQLLKKSGKCGYITPNTFFTTVTAKYLRGYFEEKQNIIKLRC